MRYIYWYYGRIMADTVSDGRGLTFANIRGKMLSISDINKKGKR
ncbi:MAG: hypothetical protein BWY09_00917 [Candidatus Hydrogenedentes bacterium ADurb.Bin179]|nr:MAG: hypothetical protein BWY09_00917 [Candidatus Hydrogenedentes bacterium ADurb.Bin179]